MGETLTQDERLRKLREIVKAVDICMLTTVHRAIRRWWRAAQCFRSFHTAERALEGIEARHMMRKGQVKKLGGKDSLGQAKFVESRFGIAA